MLRCKPIADPALASLSEERLLKRSLDANLTSVFSFALKKVIHPWMLDNQQRNEEAIENYFQPTSTQVLDSQDMCTPSPQVPLSDFQKGAKAEVSFCTCSTIAYHPYHISCGFSCAVPTLNYNVPPFYMRVQALNKNKHTVLLADGEYNQHAALVDPDTKEGTDICTRCTESKTLLGKSAGGCSFCQSAAVN